VPAAVTPTSARIVAHLRSRRLPVATRNGSEIPNFVKRISAERCAIELEPLRQLGRSTLEAPHPADQFLNARELFFQECIGRHTIPSASSMPPAGARPPRL